MKKIMISLIAITMIASATEATQLPSKLTTKQQVKAGLFGVTLGWLAFPGLVAGDVQWLSLSKKGECDSYHDIKIYMPLPVQYGTDQYWSATVPCDKWPNNNNVQVRSER